MHGTHLVKHAMRAPTVAHPEQPPFHRCAVTPAGVHERSIYSVDVGMDVVVSGGADKLVVVWNGDLTPRQCLVGHAWSVFCVTLMPSQTNASTSLPPSRLPSSSSSSPSSSSSSSRASKRSTTAKSHNTAASTTTTKDTTTAAKDKGNEDMRATAQPESRIVSCAGIWDKRLMVWRVPPAATPQQTHTVDAGSNDASSPCALSEDHPLDVAALSLADLPPHFGEIVMGGEYTLDRQQFVSSGQNGRATAQLWDVAAARRVCKVYDAGAHGHKGFAGCMGASPAFVSGTNEMLIASRRGELCVFSPAVRRDPTDTSSAWEQRCTTPQTAALQKVPCQGDVVRLPGGRHFVVCDATISIHSTALPQEPPLVLENASGRLAAVSPSGLRVVAVGQTRAQVWSLKPPRLLHELRDRGAPNTRIYGVAYSPDGRLIALADFNCRVTVWCAATFVVRRTFHMWDRAYRCAFTPDARMLLCGGDDKTIGLWDVESGLQVTRCYVGAGVGTVSVDARLRVIAGDDLGRVNFLDMSNCRCDLPVVTPAFEWDVQGGDGAGAWTDVPVITCPYTGKRFEVPEQCLCAIQSYAADEKTKAIDCPGATLPGSAFENSELVVETPFACQADGKTALRVRVNPFVSDLRSMAFDGKAVAHELLLRQVERDMLQQDLVCVRFDHGRHSNTCKWVPAKHVCFDQPTLTAEEGLALSPDTAVKAIHPNYSPMWTAQLSSDRNKQQVVGKGVWAGFLAATHAKQIQQQHACTHTHTHTTHNTTQHTHTQHTTQHNTHNTTQHTQHNTHTRVLAPSGPLALSLLQVFLRFYDGDDAHQTWNNIIVPRHPTAETWTQTPGCWASIDTHADRLLHGRIIAFHKAGETIEGLEEAMGHAGTHGQQSQHHEQQHAQQHSISRSASAADAEIRARSGTLMGRVGLVRHNVARFIQRTSAHTQHSRSLGSESLAAVKAQAEQEDAAAGELQGGKVVVYTSTTLSRGTSRQRTEACEGVVNLLLRELNVEFEERDVCLSASFARQLLARTQPTHDSGGGRGANWATGSGLAVPQVFVNGKWFADTQTLNLWREEGSIASHTKHLPRKTLDCF